MRGVDLNTVCYLEGIKVPMMKISISMHENNLCVATITLPQVGKLSEIKDGTIITVFYYDCDSEVYRLLFDGVTTGVTYNRQRDLRTRSILAVGQNKYLNDLPSQYLSALEFENFFQLVGSYEFYGMDDANMGTTVINNAIKNAFQIFNLGDPVKLNVVDYFDKVLSLLKDSWEYYYKNINKRLKISRDHVYVDEDLFKEFYRAEGLTNFLESTNMDVILNNETPLDGILRKLMHVGYRYINIGCPAYNDKGVEKILSGLKIQTNDKSMAKYVLLPDILNVAPPKCNVFIAGDDVELLNDNIRSTPITRLRHVYKIFDNNLFSRESPGDLKENKYNLTDEEYEFGIRGAIEIKSYLFNRIIGEDILKPEEIAEQQSNIVWQNLCDYEFMKKRYSQNILQCSFPELHPYGVVGFPSIVYDVPQDAVYYGILSSVNIMIDQSAGKTGTQIEMTNVRKITSLTDIGLINPFLEREVFTNINKIYDYCYNPILTGSKGVAAKVVESEYSPGILGMIGYIPITEHSNDLKLLKRRKREKRTGSEVVNSVNAIKTNHQDLFKKDGYCKREIITFGEYLYSRGLITRDNTPKSIYELKYKKIIPDMASEVTDQVKTLEEHGTTVVPDGTVFITERRDKILELLEEYGDDILPRR